MRLNPLLSVVAVVLGVWVTPAVGQQWVTTGLDIYNANSGNVGVGTSTPAEKLHIVGSVRGSEDGGALRFQTQYGRVDIGPRNASWSHFFTDRSKFWFSAPIYVAGSIGSYSTWDLILRAGGTERIRVLNSNGYVGIGTANPTSLLTVNGKIFAEEIEVIVNVLPDYVFEPDYPLMSLAELDQRIRTDRHLPGIPSADEVAENGLALGAMQSRLLLKIEELTLYTLQQQKELDQGRTVIADLETANRQLVDGLRSLEERLAALESGTGNGEVMREEE